MDLYENRPRVEATVTMLTSSDGGRRTPAGLSGQYRPHVRVRGDETPLGVVFLSSSADAVELGVPTSVALTLVFDVDYGALQPGAEFEVLEGPRVVGTGVVD